MIAQRWQPDDTAEVEGTVAATFLKSATGQRATCRERRYEEDSTDLLVCEVATVFLPLPSQIAVRSVWTVVGFNGLGPAIIGFVHAVF